MTQGNFWIGFIAGVMAMYFYINYGDQTFDTFSGWFMSAAESVGQSDRGPSANEALSR